MATPAEMLSRLMAPLKTRIANMVARAVVLAVRDSTGIQTMQIGVLADETREGCERFQQYGLTSSPVPGAEAVVLFVGGRRDHGLVVAVDDRRYRPHLEEGEVALYHKDGAIVLLKADGSIEVTAKPGADVVLNGGSASVARVGDATVGHAHAVTGAAGPFPVVATAVLATDAMAQGAPGVKA